MRLFSFLLCLLSSAIVSAGVVIDLDKIEDDYLILGEHFDFFEDSTKNYNFDEILKENDKLFSPKHTLFEVVTHVNDNYWVRFHLKASDTTSKKILEVITPQTEYVSFFVPKLDGSYSKSHSGYLLPFSQRQYGHKNFIFDFQNNTDFSKPFYIKVHSSNKVGLLFKIRSQRYFTHYSLVEYLCLGLYYGVLLILIIYNLIIYFFLKKKVYLAYCLTVLFAMGLSLSDDGMGFAFIWPNFPQWSQTLGLDIFPIGFLISYTIYAVAFLDGKLSNLRKTITYSTTAYLLYFIFEVLFIDEKFYFSYIYSVPFIVIYGSYWYAIIKNKFKPARFFVLGNTFALIGVLIEQMRLLGIIPGSTFSVYAFELGITLEFISLAISLSYSYSYETKKSIHAQNKSIRLLKENQKVQLEKVDLLQEKEKLSQKVNRELEEKVAERTKEVTEANNKLQSIVESLESMSITLDKENWQLKRVIKQEKQQRLSGNSITKEEIKELYPTKIKCLEFLEGLKWPTDFQCSKCKHTNYSINEKNRGRKCSKCGKIESVTSGSLYHSQKAPLQDLFLLTHLAFHSQKLNVSDLSNQLNLSEASIYKFIKKVKDKKDQHPKAKSWEALIYA